MPAKPTSLLICVNFRAATGKPSCAQRGSRDIADAMEKGVRERKIDIEVERICCFGHCEKGPNMRLAPGGDFIFGAALEDVPQILDRLEKLSK